MLTVKNLYKSFGKTQVLHGINFTVKEKQIVGLLGPNGAGKTTIMRIITGFLSPSRGEVLFQGKKVNGEAEKIKPFLGYLPENNPLYSFLTPWEYLEFIQAAKTSQKEKSELERILKICDLVNVARQPIDTLSRGYKQRVGLAAALIGDPQILILDEPTTGLDPNQREEIKKLIKKLNKTTLFSSHVLPEVKDICKEVIIINKGKLISQGKISQISKKKKATITATIVTQENKEKITPLLKSAGINPLSVVKKGKNKIKIEVEYSGRKQADNVRNGLWKVCQKYRWQLYELKEKEQTLEEVFRELTKE
ncbi:ABC transporter ATP-binding protein [bacterium]|nr:ABC transporter ATP-binding protein [bacterium]